MSQAWRSNFGAGVAALMLVGCGGAGSLAGGASPSGSNPTARTSSSAPADSARPLSQSKVQYGIGVTSGLQVLPQLALDSGYFKDEGLTTTITQLQGSEAVIASLQRGDLQMANTDSPSALSARLSGVPINIVAVPVTRPIFDLMVPASITKPADLAGKTVAITKYCDSNCFQLSRVLQSWGLRPQQDVKLLGLNDFPGAFAGLTSNQVSGAMLAPPFNFQALRAGYHPLTDMSQLPINYPTAVVITTQGFATTHPDTVQAVLRAYVRALYRYKSDETFVVDEYRTFLKSNDVPVLQDTWGFYQRLLHDDPSPSTEGIRFVLDNLAQLGTSGAAGADPSTFMNGSFTQQLKAAGVIKAEAPSPVSGS